MRLLLMFGLPLLSVGLGAAEPAPLGSTERVISVDHPAQWQGDLTGRYLGADPITEWDEASGKNILWKQKLPAYGCSTPLVIDGKVIVSSNPDTVSCFDAETGEKLWEHSEFDLVFPGLAQQPLATKTELRQAILAILDAQIHQAFRKDFLGWDRSKAQYKRDEKSQKKHQKKHQKNPLGFLDSYVPNKVYAAWKESVLAGDHKETVGIVKPKGELADGTKARYNTYEFARQPLLARFGIEVERNADRGYQHWCSMVFTPPISDGQRVYVQLPGPNWVAYSLDGKRLWESRVGSQMKGSKYSQPPLKWRAQRPGVLHAGKLWVSVNKTLCIIDPQTGHVIRKPDRKRDALARHDHSFDFFYLTTQSKRHFVNTSRKVYDDQGNTCGVYAPWPETEVCAYGIHQVDDLFYTTLGSYGYKNKCGVRVYKIVEENGLPLLSGYKDVFFQTSKERKSGPAMTERALKRSRGHGVWKGKLNWRGSIVGDKHMYCFGSNHFVTILDRTTLEMVDFFQWDRHVVEGGTNLPIYAGGRIYISSWDGRTAVIDDESAQVIRVNRTEPLVSTSFVAHGRRLYTRGMFHLYALGDQ